MRLPEEIFESLGLSARDPRAKEVRVGITVLIDEYRNFWRDFEDGDHGKRLSELERLRDELRAAIGKIDPVTRLLYLEDARDLPPIPSLQFDPSLPRAKSLVEQLDDQLAEGITALMWATYGRAKHQRSTTIARDRLSVQLAKIFHRHYESEPRQYRRSLCDFVDRLFLDNGIWKNSPDDKTILKPIPKELRQFRSPREAL